MWLGEIKNHTRQAKNILRLSHQNAIVNNNVIMRHVHYSGGDKQIKATGCSMSFSIRIHHLR